MEIVYVIQDGVIKIVKYTLGSVTQNVTAVSVLVQTNAYNALLMHRQTLTTIAFVTNISPGTLAQFISDIVTLYATETVMVLDHTSASDAQNTPTYGQMVAASVSRSSGQVPIAAILQENVTQYVRLPLPVQVAGPQIDSMTIQMVALSVFLMHSAIWTVLVAASLTG